MPDHASRLPARPSLEQLQKQAKELLRQYRAGEETARNRLASVPQGRTVSLADAQFMLAREYGFDAGRV
jgi:ABC-type Fe3+-hydroxamate transport system substrate-binding protein